MKRPRFNDPQIAFILRQAEEGTSVEAMCRKGWGVSLGCQNFGFADPGVTQAHAAALVRRLFPFRSCARMLMRVLHSQMPGSIAG